ncbi:hypothetical protein [Bacillus pumilus]|uniref:hypothetical protein n=1 Tax=Bacillus pumilus TaxID=1408 RepID=UPI000D046E6A|nr:hypothetical protein [Bacillus pumilus]PRS29882.1 hypothetical protein C6X99_01690 [Bacillus pumilus]
MLNNVNPNWKLSVGQRVQTLYGLGTIKEVHSNDQYGVADDEYNMLDIYDRDELSAVDNSGELAVVRLN